jgi:hypothetical protein
MRKKFGMSFTVCVWFSIITTFCNYNYILVICVCIMASYIDGFKEEGHCDVKRYEAKGLHKMLLQFHMFWYVDTMMSC